MIKLPSFGYRKVVKALRSFGWEVARQSGSHIIMTREGSQPTIRWQKVLCGVSYAPPD
jgi:predicted RNA binding protein YcfA (HicA-like mRNA interferase family)